MSVSYSFGGQSSLIQHRSLPSSSSYQEDEKVLSSLVSIPSSSWTTTSPYYYFNNNWSLFDHRLGLLPLGIDQYHRPLPTTQPYVFENDDEDDPLLEDLVIPYFVDEDEEEEEEGEHYHSEVHDCWQCLYVY